MLRDNDLIWSFVINNYLMGREPMPFDLFVLEFGFHLIEAMMHGIYLREFYLNNKLREPGGLPCRNAHRSPQHQGAQLHGLDQGGPIAPWKSTHAAMRS